jgi:hypothetical protein
MRERDPMFLGVKFSSGAIELFNVALIKSVWYHQEPGNLLVTYTDGTCDRRTNVTLIQLVDQIEEGFLL